VSKGLRKIDPRKNDDDSEDELHYYLSLTAAQRFRMVVERSILLLKVSRKNEADREPARLSKRR
jgi:hypothetical protein